MADKVVLTGVKPTGKVHIGNYIGAIRPALSHAQHFTQSLFFIADYHALTTIPDPKELKELTYDVAASWIAAGLDPKKNIIYRQSDVHEVFEIFWILSCFSPKGLMNRAHAYKARVQENEQEGKSDLDSGVNMGLYNYPILMASDILSFDTDLVPVGEDQIQHLEIARDLAQKVNHTYKTQVLKVPEFSVQKDAKIVPGLDGRKMSKSYDNTIPMFMDSAKMRKLVMKIKTDSLPPEAPKSTNDSVIFTLYKEFANPTQIKDLAMKYETGIGWGDAKQLLFEAMDAHLAPMRDKYLALMSDKTELDSILAEGAERARLQARAVLKRVRQSIGMN
ncbi:MAG: tryptophan--tRNA ligase [Bdellovibrionota bacterium]